MDIKKPLLINNIGYAGNIKADILKYLAPNSITAVLSEKILTILSAEKKIIKPEKIMIIKPYFIALKYDSFTLKKFFAP